MKLTVPDSPAEQRNSPLPRMDCRESISPDRTRPGTKKIPTELRKRKLEAENSMRWPGRFVFRLREDPQFLRSTVQFAFLLLCLWIGVEFSLFMRWGHSGGAEPFFSRPPGAEGFLPISALMSLRYWLETGVVNTVHPAGLFVFLAIVTIGLLLKKAFCSWLCPIGTLSESLWMLGTKLFHRTLTLPRWLDYIFRSVKYLLLFFFVWSISQMDVATLKEFIYSPYNKVADIKMYLFFTEIGTVALWSIGILMAFSLVIKNFWCRFLCPYGALLGALSWLSPLKISRTASTCIDCELCTKACPANISVHTSRRVWSDECTGCLACVAVCPVKDTLDIRASFTRTKVPNWVFGSLVVGVFIAITGLAMLTGHWDNTLSREEYLRRINEVNTPLYQHNEGRVPRYGPDD